jgi:hypothetical protein
LNPEPWKITVTVSARSSMSGPTASVTFYLTQVVYLGYISAPGITRRYTISS